MHHARVARHATKNYKVFIIIYCRTLRADYRPDQGLRSRGIDSQAPKARTFAYVGHWSESK
jgi:hypothetical protein